MRAFVLTGHGDLDKLQFFTDWPKPVPDANEVLIKVHACGLNNTDVNTRTAWYSKGVTQNTTGGTLEKAGDEDASWGGSPITFPLIQGADVVGTVVEAGRNANSELVGKRVLVDAWLRDWNDPLNKEKSGYFGSECDGGFAEYTKVDYRQVHVIKSERTHSELATFSTSWVTAENMLNKAKVTAGDTVLITGASGGVGSALIQLANRRNATTVAMCSKAKQEHLKEFNPDAMIDRNPSDLKAAVKQASGQEKVDVVADIVGGEDWPQLIDCLARGGRYTCSGAIAGPIVELDLRTFYLNDLTFTGATVAPPHVMSDLIHYIEKEEVKPVLAATYALQDLHQAQLAFINKDHVGNIVVGVD